jgi:hypothetical protein
LADVERWQPPGEDERPKGPRRTEIAGIGLWSAARIAGAMYGGLGVVGAAMFLVMQVALIPAAAGRLDFGWVIVMPLIYGALGAVFGAISALIYNVAASAFGGIELELW